MKWFGTVRWTYNQVLSALRAKCLNSENFQNENKWVLETPYDIRNEGMNPIRGVELLSNKLNYDCRLQKTQLGEFYLWLHDLNKGDPFDHP
ncbi:hypothetical protein Glove_104g30 [Diversispora epigaea]|uniref:Transposase putative helix-turn-helix domain-containing protein n=1 Tax=Diversispora epigaea TaxID=1348612 RepID=A0A397J9N6_9GLOM|nr:hypothetical protein Glove_104g30 [Diversispora epigaea]